MSNLFQYAGSNVYVPCLEAQGGLVINFARNPNSFSLNQYCGIRKVEKDTGKYVYIDPDEAVRIKNTQDYIWNDGQEAPDGNWNDSEHTFPSYSTTRYNFPFAIGDKSVQQAAWPIVQQHAATAASKAMTHRTIRRSSALKNASWGSNTATATSAGGGTWDLATTTSPYIEQGLMAAVQQILLASNGSVRMQDLILLLGPALAKSMAASDEVRNYMKSSPWSLPYLQGKTPVDFATAYGLPPELYGLKVVVEDAVQVTSQKGGTRSASFILGQNDAYIIGRPEGLNAGEGTGPTFNTLTNFAFELFTTQVKNDVDNRRTKGRVVLDDTFVVTAPVSGYYVSSAHS